MILTGSEIRKQVKSGTIVIDPFNLDSLNPNSYNYRLGEYYAVLSTADVVDSSRPPILEMQHIPAEGLVLLPNALYLCSTLEVIGSVDYVTRLIGKSSLGRLGLYLQISADLGHQGSIHQWTLELRCVRPLKIYAGMVIGQVTFWRPQGERLEWFGYYASFNAPTASRGNT